MFSEEYEFTAVHEAGHTVCMEHFPPEPPVSSLSPPRDSLWPRTREIDITYDKVKERFDGRIHYEKNGLSVEERLFITLGGKFAELMARTEGNWDFTAIRTRIFSGEYGDTQDLEDVNNLLGMVPESRREQVLTETISNICSSLEKNWDLIIQIATDLLSKCDPETHEGMILYYEFSPEAQARLKRLRDNG